MAGTCGGARIEPASAGNFELLKPQIGRLNVVNTKPRLQQGAARVQQGAATAATGISTAAQAAAQTAAQATAQGAQSAMAGMNSGLRAGTYSARSWVAPRLENAADYTTQMAPVVSQLLVKKVAPAVSQTLRNTARQVSPEDVRKPRWRSAFAWIALVATAVAGTGAGILAWRRYRESMAADTEPDTVVHNAGDADETPDRSGNGSNQEVNRSAASNR